MDLTFRTLGPWGAGKGANLQPSEVDTNFWNIAQAIVDLTADPALPVGISTITVAGTQMTITLTDGTALGPFTLPVLTFRWRYEWQPSTSYAVLDVFTVTNTGIFMVQIAHTTGTTFDPNLQIGGQPAYLMLFGSADASLSGLSDVQLTSLQDHDFLRWVAVDSKWENIALGSMAYQASNSVGITGGNITGMPTPLNPSDVATKGYVDALPAGATAADGTMMANIAGSVAPAIPNTLSAYLDHVLGTTTRGTLLYRGGSGWLALAPGTSGQFLETQGSGADPIWGTGSAGVTSITAGTGIDTGGAPITATGTVALAQIPDSNLLGNALGATARPAPLTLTQFLDHALTNARGTVLTRNVSGWIALLPGSSGLYLKSTGSGSDLIWDSPLGAGTVTSVAAGAGLTTGGAPITAAGTISFAQVSNGTLLANISGATAVPTPSTLSLILDAILSSTQGAVLYRSASAWAALAPGTSGQFLQTGGAGTNPSWAAASGSAPIGASQLLANLTAGTAVALGHTLSDILDYIISSSRATLLYRGASGWTGLAPGTSGQVLTTGGASSDPSWTSPPSVGSGGLIGKRIFTASTTYTPTSGTGSIVVTLLGGGGAGGGVPATTSAQQAEGAGGGAGGALQKTLATGFAGVSIVVGAAGVGASGAVGGNGGSSSFGSYTVGGGTGGALGVANTAVAGGAGGAASGGDLNIPGSRGWISSTIVNGGAAVSGRGASAPLGYGSGGEEQLASAAGVAGYGYGGGGSGAINAESQPARAGGNGAPGLVLVDEYAGSFVSGINIITSLLVHFDGTSGSTTFTDAAGGHTLTPLLTTVSTSSPKFGTGCGDFTASTNAGIDTGNAADFNLGSGQFTIEAWGYFTSAPGSGTCAVLSQFGASSNLGWFFGIVAGALAFYYSTTGTDNNNVGVAYTPALNTWIHLAVDRDASNVLRVYANGAVMASATVSAAIYASTQTCMIGNDHNGGRAFLGHLDEARISKGARYGGAFTPPTAPFS